MSELQSCLSVLNMKKWDIIQKKKKELKQLKILKCKNKQK